MNRNVNYPEVYSPIRKVVRKRGEVEPLLNEMRLKLLELQEQESKGLLMLDRFDEHGIQGLVNRQ